MVNLCVGKMVKRSNGKMVNLCVYERKRIRVDGGLLEKTICVYERSVNVCLWTELKVRVCFCFSTLEQGG